jgi:hypothetical protein
METNKALYAYFGQLGTFEDNIPGHTFYQLGLIDELSKKYAVDKFDFVNYLHTDGDSTFSVPDMPQPISLF